MDMQTISSKSSLNMEHYGNNVNIDRVVGRMELASHIAMHIFKGLACIGTGLTIFAVGMSVGLMGSAFLIALPAMLTPLAATVAAVALAVLCYGIREACHAYLTKVVPRPLAAATPEQVFEGSWEKMISHATAPQEVIEKIRELCPDYRRFKREQKNEDIQKLLNTVVKFEEQVNLKNQLAQLLKKGQALPKEGSYAAIIQSHHNRVNAYIEYYKNGLPSLSLAATA